MRPAALRQAVAAHLLEQLEGWREATRPYDLILDEPRAARHLALAVGMLPTTPTRGRQPVPTPPAPRPGMISTTTIGIRFLAAFRGAASVQDYDRALELEADLVEAIAAGRHLGLRIVDVPTRQIVLDGTTYLGEVTVRTTHVYPLATAEEA